MQSKNSILIKNIFDIKKLKLSQKEFFEDIFRNNNFRIERIISNGQTTENKKWLKQKEDEWVILLKGSSKILFYTGEKIVLKPGDYIFIPSETKHKVVFTSSNPKCVWLAIHSKI